MAIRPLVIETIRIPVTTTIKGAEVTGGLGLPEYVFEHVIETPGVAGHNRYYTPICTWFLDAAGESTLEVDTGGGFTPLVYGVDYVHLGRGFGNPGAGVPATVADYAIGFNLTVASVGGEVYRFTWKERRIVYDAPPIAKVLLDGSNLPDYTVRWKPGAASGFPPTAVTISPLNGYQVEFWRLTKHNGGMRGNHGVLSNGGRRYVPYYRAPVDQWNIPMSQVLATTNVQTVKWRFRVVYYNPATGARSGYSNDIMVKWKAQQERCNTTALRQSLSTWIE